MINSIFSEVRPGPPIEVLEMKKKYDEDLSDVKINLTVGGYKDEGGGNYILPVVKEAEVEMLGEDEHSHEYLPALGRPEVNDAQSQRPRPQPRSVDADLRGHEDRPAYSLL